MAENKNVEIEEESLDEEGNPFNIMVNGAPVPTHELIAGWQEHTHVPDNSEAEKHFMRQANHYLATDLDKFIERVVDMTMSPEEKRNARK